jgi:hypothetical protein
LHEKICGSRIPAFGGICTGRDFLYWQNLGLYFMLSLIVLPDKKRKKKKTERVEKALLSEREKRMNQRILALFVMFVVYCDLSGVL